MQAGFWPSFILYFIGVIAIVGHFLIGPLRLLQEPMENGDMGSGKKSTENHLVPRVY
ncbi:MAG: hypothetical protein WDM90_06095 [Ferruginibacter sp.]